MKKNTAKLGVNPFCWVKTSQIQPGEWREVTGVSGVPASNPAHLWRQNGNWQEEARWQHYRKQPEEGDRGTGT